MTIAVLLAHESKFLVFLHTGSWSIQFERGSGLVTLRSLHWLGFTFYHVPGTRKCGSVYVGTGNKNLDLPFML
jgi:radial spoke head protein 9